MAIFLATDCCSSEKYDVGSAGGGSVVVVVVGNAVTVVVGIGVVISSAAVG